MAFKHHSHVSPLKKLRKARGLNMNEVSVLSGVAYNTVRKIDRLKADEIGSITLGKIMRVAMLLECSPVDLVPFLEVRCKSKSSMKRISETVARKELRRQ